MVTRKCNLVPGSLEVCTKFFPAVKQKAGAGGRKKERGQRELWNRGVKPRQGRGKWVEGRKCVRVVGANSSSDAPSCPGSHGARSPSTCGQALARAMCHPALQIEAKHLLG